MPPEPPPPLSEATSSPAADGHPSTPGCGPCDAWASTFASDDEVGFALIDSNGDGAELYDEVCYWDRDHDRWVSGGGSGSGHIDNLGTCHAGGRIGDAYFAYGSAPERDTVSITFDGQSHGVPVSAFGAWAFIKNTENPNPDLPSIQP